MEVSTMSRLLLLLLFAFQMASANETLANNSSSKISLLKQHFFITNRTMQLLGEETCVQAFANHREV